uniref:Cortical cell delineating protein, putative n=1 Tax=Oryza sativa subsp. japonica TaxID=39947 RepID=Q339J6_ORYSJ|nr:Cortical cell delineating protein precursor, putative [Oryza sativa Japonica Group]
MASKVVAPFIALSLLLLAVIANGCTPNCPGEQVVPTPTHHGKNGGHGRCPMDALKLRVCANVLKGLVDVEIGHGPDDCCSLLSGIADIDAAVCLCTAVKANFLAGRANPVTGTGRKDDVEILRGDRSNFIKLAHIRA